MPSNVTPALDVSIRTRSSVLFGGKAFSVTSFNSLGVFDVLPEHASFVTLVEKLIILDKNLATMNEIKIESGVMYVADNEVAVYLGF